MPAEGVGGGKPPPTKWSDTPDRGSADSLRSAHARRPVCTLRIYTLLGILAPCLQAPCECSHPGTQGLGPRTQEKGPGPRDPGGPGGPSGPLGKGAFGALGAHGARWGYSEAIPNGCYSAGSFCGGAFSKVSFRMKSYLEVRRKQPIWK